MADAKVDSISSKLSCLDDKCSVEESCPSGSENAKVDSVDSVDSVSSKPSYLDDKCSVEENCPSGSENAKADSVSSCLDDKCSVEESRPSGSENARCCTDDITPLNLDGRLSILATHSQSTEDNESSISAELDTAQVFHTPTKRKFDQSATGLNDFMFLTHDLSNYFEENEDADSIENSDAEENFSELIFNSLLELIISTMLMEVSVKNLVPDSDQTVECKTPTYLPLLTGISKTCPPAPMRQSLSMKKFDHSICRKLDFGSSLN